MSGLPWTNHLPIRELKAGMKNTNTEFMILEPMGMNRTKDGANVWVFKVADISASINLAVIGDNGRYLRPGDICRVYNGFATVFKGALTFYVGKGGQLRKTGEFCFPICEEPYMSVVKMLGSSQHSKDSRSQSSSQRDAGCVSPNGNKPVPPRPAGLHLLAAPANDLPGSSQLSPEILSPLSRNEFPSAASHLEAAPNRSKPSTS